MDEVEQQEEKPTRRGPRRAEAGQPSPSVGAAGGGATKSPEVPVGQLIEGATGMLGHSSWVAAGALREHEPGEMMSVDAAKAEVEKWLAKPVETAEREG